MSFWSLTKTVLGPVFNYGPRFILRWRYPEERLSAKIEADLASRGGLAVLNTSVPSLVANLHVVNLLPFDVNISRCTLDISIGQPIATLVLPESEKLKSCSSATFFLRTNLSEIQYDQARQVLDHPMSGYVYINGVVEADVGFATFKKRFLIERSNHDLAAMAHYRPAPEVNSLSQQNAS